MKVLKALVVLAVAFAISLVPASATGKGLYETEVTIKGPNGDFSGKVKSEIPSCVDGRQVKVKKKTPGKDKTVGSDSTDTDGKWSTGNSGETKGKFYAKAASVGPCEAGKSKTITLDG